MNVPRTHGRPFTFTTPKCAHALRIVADPDSEALPRVEVLTVEGVPTGELLEVSWVEEPTMPKLSVRIGGVDDLPVSPFPAILLAKLAALRAERRALRGIGPLRGVAAFKKTLAEGGIQTLVQILEECGIEVPKEP